MMVPPLKSHTAVRTLLHVVVVVLMFATGFLLLIASLMTSTSNIDPATQQVTDLGALRATVGLLVLLTLPWFRRAPAVLLVAGTLSAAVLLTEPFVLAVGLTVWIVRCVRRWHWAIAAAGMGVVILNAVSHLLALNHWPNPDYRAIGQLLVVVGVLLCLVLVAGIGFWGRQKRRTADAEAHARSAAADSEQLSTQLVRQREREELAREVHDTLASRLSVLSLQTGSLESAAQRTGDEQLHTVLRTTRSYADQALTDLRVLLTSLREGGGSDSPAPRDAPGGTEDLQDLLDDASSSGLHVRPYILLDSYATAPDAVRRAVLRVTQEALTNALRHSSDRTVDVRVEGGPGRGIRLTFTNQHHPDARFEAGSGTGLTGIRERVEVLGGVVTDERTDDQFRLTVRLPWAAEHH